MKGINRIYIQYSDGDYWNNISVMFSPMPQSIRQSMKGLAGSFPGRKIRAVDEDGRIVDFL